MVSLMLESRHDDVQAAESLGVGVRVVRVLMMDGKLVVAEDDALQMRARLAAHAVTATRGVCSTLPGTAMI